MITFALPKGRLAEESSELLFQRGFLDRLPETDGKSLTYTTPDNKTQLLFVRSQDVCTYVEECSADLGIVGWDIFQEGNWDLLCPIDLKIGVCRLSLASTPEFDLFASRAKVRVATKYPELTKRYFFSRGIACEVIKLYGSIELAPLVGLADCIVDLVSTGGTLKANGLIEKEIILESSARVVCNRSSYYTKFSEIQDLLRALSPENGLFSAPKSEP